MYDGKKTQNMFLNIYEKTNKNILNICRPMRYLVKEIDVSGGESQRLYLAEFVGGQCRDDLAQLSERVVQGLRALTLAHVGHDALVARVVER